MHDGVGAFADALSPGFAVMHPEFASFLALATQLLRAKLQRRRTPRSPPALQNASPVGLAALTAMPTMQASRDANDVRQRAELQTMAAGTPFGDETDWLAYVAGSATCWTPTPARARPLSTPSATAVSSAWNAASATAPWPSACASATTATRPRCTTAAAIHDQDHARGSLYAITQLGENGHLTGGIGMGYSSYDTKRDTLNGTRQTASPAGWNVSASLDGGYIFRMTRRGASPRAA